MPDFIPDPQFEKKLKAAASAPPANPAFVTRLRGQLAAAQSAARLAAAAQPPNHKGAFPMFPRTRILLPALAVLALLVLGAWFLLEPVIPVSAQQILERSAAAQSAAKPAGGIWHIKMEFVNNPLQLGDIPGAGQAANPTIEDQYFDIATGLERRITTTPAGDLLDIFATDGKYTYAVKRSAGGTVITPLALVRTPLDPLPAGKLPLFDPALVTKNIFDQFNDNPRVKVAGKVTWKDGSPAYVLVLPNTQTQKLPGGQEQQTVTGETQAVFDANTYQLLEYKTTVRKDGQEILLTSVSYLANELLPAGTQVAWDLSDLKDIPISDEQPVDQEAETSPAFKTVTEHELAAVAEGYVLQHPPAGSALKIILIPGQEPGGRPQNYEINYMTGAETTFGMMWVGQLGSGFVAANFYDGSYKAASGLEVHYSPSGHDSQTGGTAGVLVAPGGTCFLLSSTLSREQVEALVEDLAPVR